MSTNRSGEQELLYFGRTLAGQCHELVNALNIANQLCGLHEDTLPRACEARPGAVQKLGSLAQRIQAQITRCNAIVRNLGRFAHTADEPLAACDVRDIVERAAFFALHQARLRKTGLRAVVPEGDVRPVYGSPFRLQQAIHAGIEFLLEGIAEGGCITTSLTFDSIGVVVTIESSDTLPRRDVDAEVVVLVQAAGGEMREIPAGGSIVFFIPYGHALTPALVEVADVDGPSAAD